jgi:hypothetical protein
MSDTVSHPLRTAPSSGGNATSKKSLAPSQSRLLELLQQVRYGRIHRLRVRDGLPLFQDRISWTRTVKVLGENGPHPASCSPDFVLRQEVTALLGLLTAIREGEIRNLEVRNGLPFSFEVEEIAAG